MIGFGARKPMKENLPLPRRCPVRQLSGLGNCLACEWLFLGRFQVTSLCGHTYLREERWKLKATSVLM